MSESMREEFEAWAVSSGFQLIDANTGRYHAAVQAAWMGWVASRAALCVELPVIHRDGDEGYNNAISHCRDAIHAAGVKTN